MLLEMKRIALLVGLLLSFGTAVGAQTQAPTGEREVRDYVPPPEVDFMQGMDPLANLELENLNRRVLQVESENERLRALIYELEQRLLRLEQGK